MSVQPAEELGDWGSGSPPTNARPLTRTALAFSPDGAELVFVGHRDGVQQLYLRSIEQYEARPLPGTEGAVNPGYSPDGEWLGFWSDGQIKKIPATGGSPVTICAVPSRPFGVTWTSDDTLIYAAWTGGLLEVPSAGGSPKVLTAVDAELGEFSHRLPAMLPGGRAVLFTVTHSVSGWDTSKIVVMSLETGERKVLVDGGADARYVSSGHLVYVRMGTLMAVPFDIERLEVVGDPVAIIDGIAQAVDATYRPNDTGMAQFRVSNSGTMAYVPGGIFPETRRSLVWVDRDGAIEPLDAPLRSYWSPRLSPNGSRITVYTYSNTLPQVWIYDVGRSTLSLLTPNGQSQAPKWTHYGTRVVYSSSTSGLISNLVWMMADGSDSPEYLMEGEDEVWAGSWSPDGQTLAYFTSHPETGWDLWLLPLEGEREPRPFLRTVSNEHLPSFSPDGNWLA